MLSLARQKMEYITTKNSCLIFNIYIQGLYLAAIGVWDLLYQLTTQHHKGLSPGPVGRVPQLGEKN